MSSDGVALVTGAARGQGAAIVKRLHKDGFRVAACDLLVDELTADGGRAWRRRRHRDTSRRDGRRPVGHRGGIDS